MFLCKCTDHQEWSQQVWVLVVGTIKAFFSYIWTRSVVLKMICMSLWIWEQMLSSLQFTGLLITVSLKKGVLLQEEGKQTPWKSSDLLASKQINMRTAYFLVTLNSSNRLPGRVRRRKTGFHPCSKTCCNHFTGIPAQPSGVFWKEWTWSLITERTNPPPPVRHTVGTGKPLAWESHHLHTAQHLPCSCLARALFPAFMALLPWVLGMTTFQSQSTPGLFVIRDCTALSQGAMVWFYRNCCSFPPKEIPNLEKKKTHGTVVGKV
jgi:hypothetical protein